MINSLIILRCAFKTKTMRTVCVIALEEIILLSATIKSQGCYIRINFNSCSCANEELMNNATALQSAMTIMLNEVSLLAIVHSKTMWLHCLFVLAINILADINNFNLINLWEQLCLKTVCFPTILLLFCGYQLYGT